MTTITATKFSSGKYEHSRARIKRIESIDLLRGIVMIIMALDHVRDYFHKDAFFYSPTDLSQTSSVLFFTRFITHYCAPVFVFLAGTSAYLYGSKKSSRELALYLLTRGLWMIFAELVIIGFGRTFNPSYPLINLQVMWAIGISMIALSGLIYLQRKWILIIAVLLIGGHNLLDNIHVEGAGSFYWALLHEPKEFIIGNYRIFVTYPVIPWIGIIAIGYCAGYLYNAGYDQAKRKKILLMLGSIAIVLFVILRSFNIYGDAMPWVTQKNAMFNLLSVLNVSKYPPSFLYTLVTLGPAMIFLALSEKPLNILSRKIVTIGRVPFFYYVAHIYLIHLLALPGAVICGFNWSVMILSNKINNITELKNYGFSLWTVYLVWIGLVIILYPCCKWFESYKKRELGAKPWLSYL